MTVRYFVIDGINPEPWTAPEISVGRSKGRVFPRAHKSAALDAYQHAVKEFLTRHYDDLTPEYDGPISLTFWFWRQLPTNELAERASRKHIADATNMQKALEDALQGVLFKNDNKAVYVLSMPVEQSATVEPKILIQAGYRAFCLRWQEPETKARVAMKKDPIQPPSPFERGRFNIEDFF